MSDRGTKELVGMHKYRDLIISPLCTERVASPYFKEKSNKDRKEVVREKKDNMHVSNVVAKMERERNEDGVASCNSKCRLLTINY